MGNIWRLAGAALAVVLLGARGAAAFTVISEAQEVEIGRKADQEVLKRFGYYEDPALQAYVNEVGQRLAKVADPRNVQYHFKVVDVPEVNAFALPGGYIYVTRGLLASANSEAELAGVLGHEIGHVVERHAAKQLTRAVGMQLITLGLMAASPGGREHMGEWAMVSSQLFNQILLGYGREAEFQADEMGVRFGRKAGYDPRRMGLFLRYLRIMERLHGNQFHAFEADHPDTNLRIVKAESLADILAAGALNLEVRANEYKAHLDGVTYGDKKDRKRIRIYTAKGGETIADIARDVVGDPQQAFDLSLLNGVKEGEPVKAGNKVKLIATPGVKLLLDVAPAEKPAVK